MTEGRTPKWLQLANELEQEIRNGDRPPGSLLPQIRELVDTKGWAYDTVRNAYRALEDKGLIVSRKGQGTYVSSILEKIHRDATSRYSKVAREAAGSRGAFDTEIRNLGMAPKSVSRVYRGQPPQKVAEILGVSRRGKSTAVRERTMYADDTVVQIATSYFPGDVAFGSALEQEDTGPGGSISRLAELGYQQTSMTEHLEIRQPGKEEASALGIPADRSVVEITHIGRTADGRVVEVCLHVVPANLWHFSYSWSVDQPE
ncbi:UTRA domain-containing protein [Streptomyces sp. SID8374]|uniref:UTRA domain-containing protein n=1 Tax=Streptomyces sp. SID8374 TaxID=2690354 RepID=UPI00136A60B1|nr:UTRA domain-containing protein [Streptomyces sp. SID8374]